MESNSLTLPPRQSRKAPRRLCSQVGGILILYLAIMYLAVLGTMLLQIGLELIRLGAAGIEPDEAFAVLNRGSLTPKLTGSGWGYWISSALCVLLIRLWKGPGAIGRSFRSIRPMSALVFLQLLCIFMSVQILAGQFSNVLETLLNRWGFSATAALESATGSSETVSMFLYVSILAPVTEELLFRGAVLRSFQPFGKRFAITFSALLFGLFHGNLIQIPFAFLVGLILGYVAVEYSLGWSIFLHFLNNCLFSELLSHAPVLQGILLLVLALAGLIIFLVHGNRIRRYHRSLRPMPASAVWGFLTAPGTIVLTVLCLLAAIAGITPL